MNDLMNQQTKDIVALSDYLLGLTSPFTASSAVEKEEVTETPANDNEGAE